MAHEHEQPRKVWIRARLRVRTRTHPNCAVYWGWHVAPTLEVATELQVLEPALIEGPVALERG